MGGSFRTRTDFVVAQALNGLTARHRAYMRNVANVETPGYQPVTVPFEEELRRVRDELAGDPAALNRTSRLTLQEVQEPQEGGGLDGNDVQIDRQVLQLAENSLTYEALTQAARMRAAIYRSVLEEGRR